MHAKELYGCSSRKLWKNTKRTMILKSEDAPQTVYKGFFKNKKKEKKIEEAWKVGS